MTDELHALAGLGLCALAVGRLSMLRGSATSRCLWVALAVLGLCQVLQVHVVYRSVEAASGLPGSAALMIHALTVVAAAATRALHDSLKPKRAAGLERRPAAWAAGALVVMATVYVLTPPAGVPAALAQRAEYYDERVSTAVVWGVYLLYLTWALVGMFCATRRFAEEAQPGPTRTGLRIGATGLAVGFGYVALKVVVVAGWLTGHGPALVALDATLEALILACCLLLIAVGSCYEVLSAAATRLSGARARRRSLRRLSRLAESLKRSCPGAQYRLPARDHHQRLILRVTDIRDAQRVLRAHTPTGARQQAYAAAQADGYDSHLCQELAVAAALELAMRSRAAGGAPAPSRVTPPSGGLDLAAEVACLERLAAAYEHEFVGRYVERYRTDPSTVATSTA